MKRHLRILLLAGLVFGSLAVCSPSTEAGIFGRGGPFRGYGWRNAYAPGYAYGIYRPYGYGYGWGGNGMTYRTYGWRFGNGYGYPLYNGYGLRGYSGYGYGSPAYGYGLGGYPAVYGTSLSIGTGPYGGFYMSSYPY